MEDKDKKKNVKKIIVYAVLLVLIMGIALGTGQIQTEELGRIFTVNAVAVCKLLLLIFSVIQSDKIYCVSGDPVRRTDDPRS